MTPRLLKALLLGALGVCALFSLANAQPLPGTAPLEIQGDIASNLVAGADRFLLRKLDQSAAERAQFWHRDFSSAQAYEQSLSTNRLRLAHILGVRDQRVDRVEMELIATPTQRGPAARGQGYEVFAVRWPAFGDVHGEGLLLSPIGRAPVADIVAIPDAGQTPEQIAGLTGGVAPESQFARRLAESGCRVIIPALISRRASYEPTLSNREFIYRPAYELGRHLIGYEIQKVLSAIDWMTAQSSNSAARIGVIGWGEGGLLAFYSAALDSRITATCVSGYFDNRTQVWKQPADRNVFGLLERFGDAEVAAMIAPRSLIVEAARGPEVTITAKNGAPGKLESPRLEDVRSEIERARTLVDGLSPKPRLEIVVSDDGAGPYGSEGALTAFLAAMGDEAGLTSQGPPPQQLEPGIDPAVRENRQLHELDRHNQWLLTESQYTREKFMSKLDTSSPEKFQQSADGYRDFFYRQVIGRFDDPMLPPNPRSRKTYDEPKWTGYEVVLDVFPDLIANGILLVPKDIKPGERRRW